MDGQLNGAKRNGKRSRCAGKHTYIYAVFGGWPVRYLSIQYAIGFSISKRSFRGSDCRDAAILSAGRISKRPRFRTLQDNDLHVDEMRKLSDFPSVDRAVQNFYEDASHPQFVLFRAPYNGRGPDSFPFFLKFRGSRRQQKVTHSR